MRRTSFPSVDRRSSVGGGEGTSGNTLADKVFDLSRALGTLRARSITNVEALRSVAQGVPELDQAFRPLLAALEVGLAECHQADLEAIFGRPEPRRDMLESPPPPQIGRGFGRVRGGGTGAAAQRLATALSVLDRDVEAAGMLVEDGASLRTVVRWTRRARTSAQSLATAPALEGEATPAKHTSSGDQRAANKSETSTDNDRGVAEGVVEGDARNDWTLRIFREPVSGVDGDCAVDSGSGRGNGVPPNHAATTDGTSTTDGRSRDSTSRDGRSRDGTSGACAWRCRTKSGRSGGSRPLLMVLNALRAPLPPVCAVPTNAAFANGGRVMDPTQGGLRAEGEAGRAPVPAPRSQWRNPFSWLTGYYWRSEGEVCRDPGAQLSMTPPAPVVAPPRVVVRVVFVGHAPDVARFARATERRNEVQECTAVVSTAAVAADAGASSAAGDGHASRPNGEGGDTVEGTPPWVGGTGKDNAAVVELVRSEVRVRRACFPAAGARENLERACTNGADTESGLVSRSPTQLQIVLELRTRTPVVVSRVLHTGGGVLPPPHLCVSSPASPSSPRGVSVQSALPSPLLGSSFLRPSVLATGRSAVVDRAGPVAGCSGRSGSGAGRGSGGSDSGGGSGGGVDFDAGVGRRENGSKVGAGEAGCERAGAGGGRQAIGGACDQGGGGLNSGCLGQGCGVRDADEGDEIIPSGWVEAPAELQLPGDSAEHGPKLKVGTRHVLGMNVVVPELPSENSDSSPAQVNEPTPKQPLQRTSFYDGAQVLAPRGCEPRAAEAQEKTPPTSKKRKVSFGGTDNDQQQVHTDQVERQGVALPRTSAKKRSRVSKANGAWAPGSSARGVGHGTGGLAGSDSLDSRWCGGGQGGSLVARNASRSSRLRGGGGGGDSGGGSGGFSAGQEDTDDGTGAVEVRSERKTWWGWRFPSLWGRETSGEVLLPDPSPAPRQTIQQQRQQQSTQSREAPLSGMSGVQASGSMADNRVQGVNCDTFNVSPQSEARNRAAGSRGAMEGGAPSSDFGVSREFGGSRSLKRSPLVITVVLAAPPVGTPA